MRKKAIEYMMRRVSATQCSETKAGQKRCGYYRLAIAALREKLEREKGCDFCNAEYAVMSGSRLTEDEMHCGCTAIYCPKCGKYLKGAGHAERNNL